MPYVNARVAAAISRAQQKIAEEITVTPERIDSKPKSCAYVGLRRVAS